MQTFTGYDEATQVMDRDDIAAAATPAPGAHPAGAAPTPPPREDGEGKGWRWASLILIIAILAILAALVIVGRRSSTIATGSVTTRVAANPGDAAGLDLGDSAGDAVPDPTTTPPTTSAVTTPSTVVVTVVPPTAPPTTATPTTTPPTTAAPTTTTTTATAAIGSFSVPAKVDCNDPMNQTPYISVSWSTAFTTKVSISIDGPGVYKNYGGGNGSDTVPFSCPGPHTYTLTATDGTHTVTKTVQVVKK